MRLVAAGTHTQVIAELVDKAEVLDFDTVRRDLDGRLQARNLISKMP